MESRRFVETPQCEEHPSKAKHDDFEPPVSSGGPLVEDGPHGAYDIEVALPTVPPEDSGK